MEQWNQDEWDMLDELEIEHIEDYRAQHTYIPPNRRDVEEIHPNRRIKRTNTQ